MEGTRGVIGMAEKRSRNEDSMHEAPLHTDITLISLQACGFEMIYQESKNRNGVSSQKSVCIWALSFFRLFSLSR